MNQPKYKTKDIYCNNCGMKGHIYKNCKHPVISCGNLIFRTDENISKILMIQRKDSLCYIEFIRGKYNLYNINYIQILIEKCTNSEKENLLKKSYDILWKELWLISEDDNNYNLLNDYYKGNDKFKRLSKGFHYNKTNEFINIEYFIKKSKTNYLSTEWEFPKGRRNNRETNLECAKREFKEETNYLNNDYQLIHNILPFTEEFIGENKVKYKYIYYIGYLTNYVKEIFIDPKNKDQYTELKNIKWFTKDEALLIIRDYHYTRRDIIYRIFNFIEDLNKDYILV